MSTVFPQLVSDESPIDLSFHDSYLSAPLDPEQASFKSSGLRVTPEPAQHHMRDISTGYTTSYSDFLSPDEEFSSDLSSYASPNASGGLGVDVHSDFNNEWQHDLDLSHGMHNAGSNGAGSPQMNMDFQLLTPDLTNNTSPASDTTNAKDQDKFNAMSLHPDMFSVITSPTRENLSIHLASDAARARSPIVKVESYSRGDSPVRDTLLTSRRPSQSSVHLSPAGEPEEVELDGTWHSNHTISRTLDGVWIANSVTNQSGIEPTSRGDTYILSPNEMESQRQREDKNADIRCWSATVSVANSEAGDETPDRRVPASARRRARSTGDPAPQQDYFNFHRPTIPGPGILVDEKSDEEFSECGSEMEEGSGTESPAASVNEAKWTHENSPSSDQLQLENGEPSPHQFLRTRPWQDPVYDSSPRSTNMQPATSSAAMAEYQRRARDIDAMSRYATWGTRPISEADVNSLIGGSFERISINKDTRGTHERKNSIKKFLGKIPSRGGLKRTLSEQPPGHSDLDGINEEDGNKSPPQRKDSFPHRKLSIGLGPKSPNLSTGGAVIAIAGQMAAIGGGRDSLNAVPPNSTSSSWSPFTRIRRSKSDISKASVPGLIDLMTSHGGPPVANIAYSTSPENIGTQNVGPEQGLETGDDDEEDDDMADEKGLVMDLQVLSRLPVPTLEGFRIQITQLNPRLQPALVERLANEQVRRYKKLVDNKLGHTRAVSKNNCPTAKFCFAQGGEATLLPPRASPQDSNVIQPQFHIAGPIESDDDRGEGVVTATQFPTGVPLPPVKRLPAEFECPICFRVRKFQKPSDWTKHVHEDVQPFTCTFPQCNEPKSFKRKADWVRHESERHRQLEWWACTVSDCQHKCYRKDNFVQHLVREHKFPEPKAKKTKTKGSGAKYQDDSGTPETQDESNRERLIGRLWELVETCRHDTPKNPKEEPCRFCGNVCSSWKKLNVHLAKHMEQIAMPILRLVQERDLSSTDAGLVPKAISYPGSVTLEATTFTSNLNGIKGEADMSIDFTQAQYISSEAERPGGLVVPFNPTYPPTSTTLYEGILSAEPESMDMNDNTISQYGSFPGQLGVDHLQFMPAQHNSVTYPPPFNAMPRPRSSHPDLSVVQDPSYLSSSPPEMHATYDSQGTMYMPPSAANNYVYQAPNMSYDSSAGYQTQL